MDAACVKLIKRLAAGQVQVLLENLENPGQMQVLIESAVCNCTWSPVPAHVAVPAAEGMCKCDFLRLTITSGAIFISQRFTDKAFATDAWGLRDLDVWA